MIASSGKELVSKDKMVRYVSVLYIPLSPILWIELLIPSADKFPINPSSAASEENTEDFSEVPEIW